MRSPRTRPIVTALALAQRRAKTTYPTSVPFQTAYVQGARAAISRQPVDVCPYRRGGTGWARVYRAAWLRGYLSARP